MGGAEGNVVDIDSAVILGWGGAAVAVIILAGCAFCVRLIWEMWRRGRAEESLEDFLARHSAANWPPPPRQNGYHDRDTE